MKKILSLVLALALVVGCCALVRGNAKADSKLLGVSMPTQDLQRWNQDGANMKAKLEEAGYEVELLFAANDIPTQVSQIETMIADGCQVLVIASICSIVYLYAISTERVAVILVLIEYHISFKLIVISDALIHTIPTP